MISIMDRVSTRKRSMPIREGGQSPHTVFKEAFDVVRKDVEHLFVVLIRAQTRSDVKEG